MSKTELSHTDVYLEFVITRVEADLAKPFLKRETVTLGGAAARSDTDLCITGARKCTSLLITEREETIRLPIDEIVHEKKDAPHHYFQRYVDNAGSFSGQPVVQISSRARLNITASRIGASINGSIVSTMSGQGSILLRDMLQMVGCDETAQGRTFAQVPVQYAGWENYSAVFGIHSARIVTKSYKRGGGEDEYVSENVICLFDHDLEGRMETSQMILKEIYESAWKLRENVIYPKSPFLHKSIARVPVGCDASTYDLAVLINDVPSTFTRQQMEAILKQCIELEFGFPVDDDGEDDDNTKKSLKGMLNALAHAEKGERASFASTKLYAQELASAVSTYQSYTKPYRIDGTPIVLPSGTKMVSTESWLMEPSRSIMAADDCDGSASSAISVVQECVNLRDEHEKTGSKETGPVAFPYMHAIANSLGSHFVFGVSVLGANAGRADDADTEAEDVAGHAVAILIPKIQFLIACLVGAKGILPNESPVVDRSMLKDFEAAMFRALYPSDLVDQMPVLERDAFRSWANLKTKNEYIACNETSIQFLAMEGTTPACSRTYEHNPTRRVESVQRAKKDKIVSSMLSPNIARSFKSLDSVKDDGGHGFYDAFCEFSVSIRSNLFTSSELRKLGHATPHFVIAQKNGSGEKVAEAGATPMQIANGDYSIIPLWRVHENFANILDESTRESTDNLVASRGLPYELTEQETNNLTYSISVLKELSAVFETNAPSTDAAMGHVTQHLFSFAALARNPHAVAQFVSTVKSIKGVHGKLDVRTVDHIAKYPNREAARVAHLQQNVARASLAEILNRTVSNSQAKHEEEKIDLNSAGRFVVVNLEIPI